MAYVINYLPIAKKDLLEIVDYISEKLEAPRAALNFIDEIEKKIMGLKANPYSHRLYRPSKPIDTEYRLLTSISQNSVSFVKCSWKSGQKSAFPHKSKVAFPKTEVLGKPLTVKNYLVFYVVADNTVEIHRIIYNKRNLPKVVT